VKFEEVTDVSSEKFREAARIYIAAFPESKWRPVATMKELISSGRLRLIIGIVEDQVVFMSTLYPIRGTPFVLGDYITVADEYRGRGISRQFNEDVFCMISGLKFDYLLAEVEDPYLDSDEQKTRRVNYYRRIGFKEMKGVRYSLPPYQGTSTMEMILMVLCWHGEVFLDGAEIRDIIARIFRELHNRDRNDPILTRNIEGVPDRIELI
jgi:hypothetical protein